MGFKLNPLTPTLAKTGLEETMVLIPLVTTLLFTPEDVFNNKPIKWEIVLLSNPK